MCVLFAVCSAALLCPLLRAVRCGAALLCCALYYVLCAVLCVCVCCVPPGPGSPKTIQKQRNSKQTTRISHSRDKQHQRISTGKRRVLVQRIQTAEASENHAHALRNLSRCVLCAVQCCCAMPCTTCCALCCCAGVCAPGPAPPQKPETFTKFLDAVLLCCYAVPCALGTSSRRSSRSTSNKRSSRSISSWSSRSTSSRRSNRSTSSRRSNRSTNSRRSSRSRSSSSRRQHEQEQQQVLLGIAGVLF